MAIKNRNIFVRACPIAQSGVVEIKDFSFSIWTEYPSHNPFNIDLNLQEAKSVYKLLEKEIKDKENWIKKNYGDEISNAKLIAASPDLLRLIKQVLPDNMGGYPDLFHPDQGWENWEKEVLQVIAKIEGEKL